MSDVQWVSSITCWCALSDATQSAGISLFYAGYMLTQLPGSLLLSKYKPRIVIPLMM
jgi:hypothetical protein